MNAFKALLASTLAPAIAEAISKAMPRNIADQQLARRADDKAEPEENYRTRPRVKYAFIPRRSTPPAMTPQLAQVYEAFKSVKESVISFAELMEMPGIADMNPVTVRWAVQQLRQRGLIESIDVEP